MVVKLQELVADALRLEDAEMRGAQVSFMLPWGQLNGPEQTRWLRMAAAALEAFAKATSPDAASA